MANVDKELKQIRGAVYGKEVRGSIADGLEKVNNESTEAIEVTEQLIDGSFDQGKLDTNIKERLEQLEDDYTPRLTGLEHKVDENHNEVTAQLADKANQSQVYQLENNKADKAYVDDLFTNLDGLEIKGSFDTLKELEDAFPSGTTGLYVVDKYLYGWNGNKWKVVKELGITPWNEFMTTDGEKWEVS